MKSMIIRHQNNIKIKFLGLRRNSLFNRNDDRRDKISNMISVLCNKRDSRSYVGTAEEIAKYKFEKKKALRWVAEFSKNKGKVSLDQFTIGLAIKGHLRPIHEALVNSTDLVERHTLVQVAIVKSAQMLWDLRYGLNRVNLLSLLHHTARIVAFDPEHHNMCERYPQVVLQFIDFLEIALPMLFPREICSALWSLGKFGPGIFNVMQCLNTRPTNIDVAETVDKLIARASDVLAELSPRDLSNLLGGMLNLGIKPEIDLFVTINKVLNSNIETADAICITRLLGSFSKIKYDLDPQLLENLISICETKIRVGHYSIAEMIYIISSLKKLRAISQCQILCAAIDRASQVIFENHFSHSANRVTVSFKEIKQLLCDFVELRYFPKKVLFNLITKYCITHIELCTPWCISGILLAFAEFGQRPEQLFKKAEVKILSYNLPEMQLSPKILWELCWALALVESLDAGTLEATLRYTENCNFNISIEDKVRIYRCILHIEHILLKAKSKSKYFICHIEFLNFPEFSSEDMIENWKQKCKACWEQSQNWDLSVDQSEMDKVLDLLTEMGYTVERDCELDIDIKITKVSTEGGYFAFENVESKNFFNNKERLLGRCWWRERLLKSQGINVINLNFQYFKGLKKEWQKMEYIKNVFNMALADSKFQ